MENQMSHCNQVSVLIHEYAEIQARRCNDMKTLLATIQQKIVERHVSSKSNIIRLLDESKPHIKRIEQSRQKDAPDFNVFSALGVVRKEVIQSRFLVYLLSPKEHHNQGTLFLSALLQSVGIAIAIEDLQKSRVSAEFSAGENLGRMDILIDCKPWLIVIENKIDAGEGNEQLARYQAWLSKQSGYHDDKKWLIFLTPTGHESVTGKVGSYQQVSYSNLAAAFAPLLESQRIAQLSVRAVLSQYVSMCRLIGEEDMTMQDKELQRLIIQPENFSAALELEQQVALMRNEIAKDFCEFIKQILQNFIAENATIKEQWRAVREEHSIKILTKNHRIKSNYHLFVQGIFTLNGNKGGWFGWFRPISVDLKTHQETKLLTAKMLNDGYTGNAEVNWVGFSFLRQGSGSFLLSNNNDIIACEEDNRSVEHPLAKEVAEEIWTMFSAYHANIEALESFKIASS